jgi:DNA-binding GntR family transcriptional regulator
VSQIPAEPGGAGPGGAGPGDAGPGVADAEPGGAELVTTSLVDLAVDRLRREILRGLFAPGERIVEEQATRRLGISRAPLREALRLLAQQGLVEHLPRRGVRVARLSDQDVDELFEMREVLEQYAARRALPRPRQALAGLRTELAAMDAAAHSGDGPAQADAHRRFHTQFVSLAGRRQLLLTYEPVLLKLQLHMATNLRREAELADPLDGVRRHAVLLRAVESGDLDVALHALADHGARTYLP